VLLPLFWDMMDSFLKMGFGYRAAAKLLLFYSAFGIRGTPGTEAGRARATLRRTF
jgi:hypothetical protein